ncbi:FtsX-like permease family protein [Paenibacillus koleovorans]|uniref:FtsX-like permease family protein n=1 Tax=Paenibacillus koleovorans TaxID=121608 RepID=UPI0027D8CEBE|nr:FtsX-like permease family protein [Paenibacillus koleovorans]
MCTRSSRRRRACTTLRSRTFTRSRSRAPRSCCSRPRSLAVIALFALASVIYFKQLREATEEQQQFGILRKIGVDNGVMKSVIRKKLLLVFAPPLVLGILISWTSIKTYILDSVQDYPGLVGMVWGIMAAYFVIYILLYVSSTNVYFRIVTRKA